MTTRTQTRVRRPQPALDYDAALAQLATLQALDGPDVNPLCHTQALTHGRMTERVIVLIHGMTNCPCQYQGLAPLFFARGYNVLTPRMPRNGLNDRDTKALASLTIAELQEYGHQIVDIARGLGERVTVTGISAGGTIAAWLAQVRSDVDVAAPIAPLFGILPDLPVLNGGANLAVMHALASAPNLMTQRLAPFRAGPPQCYRGFATHGLARVMELGRQVMRAAATEPPTARAILMMLNPKDPAVNGTLSHELLRRWRARNAHASLYTFAPERQLIHDIIDPQQLAQQCDYVYPILLEQITSL